MPRGQFEYLFSPIKIKGVTIRNRIVSTGHGTWLASRGIERLAAYHAERAKGGVGLIITEPVSVHPTSRTGLRAWNEKVIPDFEKLTTAVHAHGAKIFAQVGHIGRQYRPGATRLIWAPSPMPYRTLETIGLTPKEMETEDIREVVNAWGKAAYFCKLGGFDGVEIHSAYGGYLLSAFLSPYSNKRTDDYGGSLDNRMRIVYEVIDSVRKSVGADYVVGIQLNADDLTPSGLGLDDYTEIARRIEATGKVDYMVVKAGTYWSSNMAVPDMQHPLGLWVPFASKIKSATDKMFIVCVGRINDPVLAEKILAEGYGDLVGMCRAQIADPELANKAQEGRLDDIRPCIACNAGCFAWTYGSFSCTHNPAAGNERELGIGTLKPARVIKKVMVVGGGPGGLKVAEVAAQRGHKVSLYEKKHELGGQVKIAAKAPGREELEGVTRYLIHQVEKLGVEIHLDTDVTPDVIKKVNPNAVVVATGSVPRRISFTGLPPFDPDNPEPKGFDQDNVFTPWDILEKGIEVGSKVMVADDGEGNWKGISIAELLLDRGKKVEVISPLDFLAQDIHQASRMPLLRRLFTKGIIFTPYTAIKEISGRTVVVYNIFTRQERIIEDVDNVVLAYYNKADDQLYFALKGQVKELYRIGDCLVPRSIGDAIRDGERIGRLL